MTGGGRYGGASGKLVRSSMKREERQGRSGIPPVNKVLCEVQRLKLLALRCSWFKFLFLVGSYGNNQSRESKLLKGPSQIQSNTLAALEAIDVPVAEEVMDAGCIIGDRINGLVDGVSGAWFIKFDTFTPAVSRGLPVTRVRTNLFGRSEATYSGYTCYSGIADFVPAVIESVGYVVFKAKLQKNDVFFLKEGT
ncbi:hypothetical protein Rs2_44698 [Raphanus sativus]|nr:hypothetical protein Rs2_44698 [Raphanus sativus]